MRVVRNVLFCACVRAIVPRGALAAPTRLPDALSAFTDVEDDEAVVRGAAADHDPGRDLWISDWAPGRQLAVSSARMRVELEAKRRLVAWARERGDEHVLRMLAMVYDDHVDWQPEWSVLESVDGHAGAERSELNG